jgi:hypothetical protein
MSRTPLNAYGRRRVGALLQFVPRCLKYMICCFFNTGEVIPRVLGGDDESKGASTRRAVPYS